MRIIGITGTLGAGKGAVVEYLVKHYGFKHYSARTLISERVLQMGLPLNRDSMVTVANIIREGHGSGYIIEQLYNQALETKHDCVIESVRTVGEVDVLKKHHHFRLFAVDADPEVRYKRIVGRGSATDNITYDKFLRDEKREMDSTDPNKQNLRACIQRADVIITNNGSIPELRKQIDEAMQHLQ